MPDFTTDSLEDVLAACNSGAGETAGALSRTLDAELSMAVGESATLTPTSLPDDLNGPGLAILFLVESAGAVLLLPESTSLVPAWCAKPDATGTSKLATLAQELGMNLLPEAFMPTDFKVAYLGSLSEALLRSGMHENAASVSLNLATADGKECVARLVWPLATPMKLFEPPKEEKPEAKPASKSAAAATSPQNKPSPQAPRIHAPTSRQLPEYTKSLLKIRVPVVVTLAEKKQPLSRIVEMGPGMIIQFEKSCEEMLDLEVGNHKIASGEAIKVGDKFGLRITSIVLPEERFKPVKPKKRLG